MWRHDCHTSSVLVVELQREKSGDLTAMCRGGVVEVLQNRSPRMAEVAIFCQVSVGKRQSMCRRPPHSDGCGSRCEGMRRCCCCCSKVWLWREWTRSCDEAGSASLHRPYLHHPMSQTCARHTLSTRWLHRWSAAVFGWSAEGVDDVVRWCWCVGVRWSGAGSSTSAKKFALQAHISTTTRRQHTNITRAASQELADAARSERHGLRVLYAVL
jgi:hypothetical protein